MHFPHRKVCTKPPCLQAGCHRKATRSSPSVRSHLRLVLRVSACVCHGLWAWDLVVCLAAPCPPSLCPQLGWSSSSGLRPCCRPSPYIEGGQDFLRPRRSECFLLAAVVDRSERTRRPCWYLDTVVPLLCPVLERWRLFPSVCVSTLAYNCYQIRVCVFVCGPNLARSQNTPLLETLLDDRPAFAWTHRNIVPLDLALFLALIISAAPIAVAESGVWTMICLVVWQGEQKSVRTIWRGSHTQQRWCRWGSWRRTMQGMTTHLYAAWIHIDREGRRILLRDDCKQRSKRAIVPVLGAKTSS